MNPHQSPSNEGNHGRFILVGTRDSGTPALSVRSTIAALLVAMFNLVNLIEAYGSGPPYYSRTVNMDKWQSPMPVLFVIDVATFVLLALGIRWLKRTA